MSAEIIVTTTTVTVTDETPSIRPRAGVIEHWCEHPGCVKWGSFGFPRRAGSAYFCMEHRADGEQG